MSGGMSETLNIAKLDRNPELVFFKKGVQGRTPDSILYKVS